MALTPWPESQADIDAAVLVLAAALPPSADAARLGRVCAELVEEYSPGAPQPDSRRSGYPHGGLAA